MPSPHGCACTCLARCIQNECAHCCGCDRTLGDRRDTIAGKLEELETNMIAAQALGSFFGTLFKDIIRPSAGYHLWTGLEPIAPAPKDTESVLD